MLLTLRPLNILGAAEDLNQLLQGVLDNMSIVPPIKDSIIDSTPENSNMDIIHHHIEYHNLYYGNNSPLDNIHHGVYLVHPIEYHNLYYGNNIP